MKNTVRTIFAVVLGALLGSAVNMGMLIGGSSLIPPPEGMDVTNAESIKALAHLFEAKHFLFPFLAHALGTLIGALIAFLVAGSNHRACALIVGGLFLLGGIANCFMIPAPVWFIISDLVLAYIPMGWLGAVLGGKFKKAPPVI